MYAKDSIDLLQTCGIQFKKHEEEGVDVMEFAELLMTSGVILCDNVKWISFHRWRFLKIQFSSISTNVYAIQRRI